MESARHLEPHDAIASVPGALVGKILGLAIVSLIPALFWTGVLALIGPLIGIAFSVHTLTVVGSVIAIFLSLVFSALALVPESRDRD